MNESNALNNSLTQLSNAVELSDTKQIIRLLTQ